MTDFVFHVDSHQNAPNHVYGQPTYMMNCMCSAITTALVCEDFNSELKSISAQEAAPSDLKLSHQPARPRDLKSNGVAQKHRTMLLDM